MIRFIRSPLFDGLFIWSGIPIGLGLAALSWSGNFRLLFACVAALTILDATHLLNPMAMVVVHPVLRQRALSEPLKFIFAPALLLVVPTLFWGQLGPLAPYAFVVRGIYNCWHFGCQQFGLVQIYRRLWGKPGCRSLDRWLCLGLTAAITIPFAVYLNILGVPPPHWMILQITLPQWLFVLCFGAINVNHWLASIGLSLKVMGNSWWWWSLLALMAVSGFAWNMGVVGVRGLGVLVYLNFGVGLAHYWIDGLIWRRGEPAMRAVMA